LFIPSPSGSVVEEIVFRLTVRCVRSYRHILLQQYHMNCFSNLDKTSGEYSLAPNDDLIRFRDQRSRSQQSVEMAKTSTSVLVEINLLVYQKSLVLRILANAHTRLFYLSTGRLPEEANVTVHINQRN